MGSAEIPEPKISPGKNHQEAADDLSLGLGQPPGIPLKVPIRLTRESQSILAESPEIETEGQLSLGACAVDQPKSRTRIGL